jgi:hypothetical protein
MSCHCNKQTCPECNNCKGGNNEYLLVKATSSSSCGSSVDNSETDCPKQEPTFDTALTGFLIPIKGENISFRVCNGAIYDLNQWLYFSGIGAYVRISAIDGSNITVTSGCENGNDVVGNTYYGQTVPSGSVFNVSGKPGCVDDEVDSDALLENATQICVPDLVEEPEDLALMQVVARVEENDDDLSFAKCIKRIKNFLWQDGTPIWSALKEIPYANYFQNEYLGIDSSGKVAKFKKINYSETLYKLCAQKLISSTPISLFNRGTAPDFPAANPTTTSSSLILNNTTFGGLLTELAGISANFFAEVQIEYMYQNTATGERGVDIELDNAVIASERINGIGRTSGSIIRIIPLVDPYPNIQFGYTMFGTTAESNLYLRARVIAVYV